MCWVHQFWHITALTTSNIDSKVTKTPKICKQMLLTVCEKQKINIIKKYPSHAGIELIVVKNCENTIINAN